MRMRQMTRIMRHLLIFIFPLPFLVGFGSRHMGAWPGTLALAAAAALLICGIWLVWRRR